MKKIVYAVLITLIIVGVGIGGWFLYDSLQKEKNKTGDLENRLAKIESMTNLNIENSINKENIVNNEIKNNEIQNDEDETKGDLGEYSYIANEAIKKCFSDTNWLNKNRSSDNAKNKFIKISNINEGPAYIVDSDVNGNHTVVLIFYKDNKVQVKKKTVSNNHKTISVDAKNNILVLGNFRQYLNDGESDDDISLNTITSEGFIEYGASGEVPTLNGDAISFGAFKSRTESINEESIVLDLNKSNIEKYVK